MKEIYKRLGLTTNISSERIKFVNRIKRVITNITDVLSSEAYEIINHEVSFKLGLDEDDFVEYIDVADFDEALVWCEIVLAVLAINNKREFGHFENMIIQAIDESILDLDVIYKEGRFYQKGAEELGQTLVMETLDWLETSPAAKANYGEALKEYIKKDYPDAITKCYSALEGLIKNFLNTNKTLDKSVPELLSRLSLSN